MDKVTQGAKPSLQGEGEWGGQGGLPGPSKRGKLTLFPDHRDRMDPQREQTGFQIPRELGEEFETGPPRGGTGWEGQGLWG